MAQYLNEQLQDLYLLLKALQKNDEITVKNLRKKTGVDDDYETLMATFRFMQIGMAPTYEIAKEIYKQEQEIILKTKQNRESVKLTYEFIDRDINSFARREWVKQDARNALDERLKESEQDLKDAQTYHNATFGNDD